MPEADRITETSKGSAHIRSLRREGARGGLTADVFHALQQDRIWALDIAYSLLDAHFPDTLHDDILRAVGIHTGYAEPAEWDPRAQQGQVSEDSFHLFRRRVRDPAFSKAVLEAYGERCAVCAFSVRLHDRPVALDAAHIKWHRAGGLNRDEVSNGLSLCALHHKLFDAGAFTLSLEYKVIIAAAAVGAGKDQSLGQFERRSILLPKNEENRPNKKSLKWHHREVFGPINEGVHH